MRRSLPEIRVRIQHPDEPDAYPWWEFDTEDAAAIRDGHRFPYVVEVLDEAGRLLDDLSNLVAGPGIEGTYRTPWAIPDASVAYYAADCWAYACGIEPGTLINLGGWNWRVLYAEHVDNEYGSTGVATGYLICHPAAGRRLLVRVPIEQATRQVLALTTPKCSTLGCHSWATHTLETDNPDPVPYEPEREREPVCEPCGTEYVQTNRIKRLNGVLTKGTV